MLTRIPLLLIGLFALASVSSAASLEESLDKLAGDLALGVAKAGVKKASVADFYDLQGNTSELGRHVAEQLSISLVISSPGFAVMDRANLRSVLAEHKLTADGLVNPANARKLGQFAGVDAIVLGTVAQVGDNFVITARAIATESSEVVAAARITISKTPEVEHLYASGTVSSVLPAGTSAAPSATFSAPSKAAVIENVAFDLASFQRIEGGAVAATLRITNRNPASVRLAVERSASFNRSFNVGLVDETGGQMIVTTFQGVNGSRSTLERLRKDQMRAERYSAAARDLAEEVAGFSDLSPGQSIMLDLRFQAGAPVPQQRFRLEASFILATAARSGVWNLSSARLSLPDIQPK